MLRQSIPMEELVQLLQLQMQHGGQASLVVTGVSMLPMLMPHRDSVFLEFPQRPLQPGDVILYRRKSGSYILHRVIAAGDELVCCGDNQWQKESVSRNQVIAVVTAFQRRGKHREIDSLGYRLYVWCWVKLFPMRRMYITIRRRLGNFCRWIVKNK